MQDLTKEDLLKKVHDLETEGKIVNKLNRNKDFFHVSKDVLDAFAKNIIEKTPIVFHDSFFETPNINQTDSQSFSNSFSRESRSSSLPDFGIITNTPDVPHINHDAENIRETESLADNMFEKLKVDGIKKEIMSELQKSIENLFRNELSVFKEKCEELVSKSYANGMVHIEKLEKEIKSKDQIINHLLVSLESLTRYPNRNAVIDDTVTSPGLLETLPQSNQTGNSLETRKGIDFVKDIIKPHSHKENNDENNNISNTCITSIKSQLELVRKEKHDIYLKQKCSEYYNKEKSDKANNDETPGNFKHAWPTGTCLIVGDSILTGIDEKRLSRNNQVVKVRDFRGATIDDLKHHLVPLLKKKPEHIILHIGTNDAVSKTSRQILDELL